MTSLLNLIRLCCSLRLLNVFTIYLFFELFLVDKSSSLNLPLYSGQCEFFTILFTISSGLRWIPERSFYNVASQFCRTRKQCKFTATKTKQQRRQPNQKWILANSKVCHFVDKLKSARYSSTPLSLVPVLLLSEFLRNLWLLLCCQSLPL